MAISKEELQKILEASQKKSQKAQSAPIKEAKPIEQIEKNLFKNVSKDAKEQQHPSKKRKAKRVAAIVGAGIMATSVAAAAVVVPVVIYQEHKSFLLEVIPGGESGAKLEPLTVHPGTTAKELPDIVVPGYKFRGYFSDKNCTKALNPSLEITKEMTIYAKFVHEYDLTVYINGTKQIVKYYDDFTVGQILKDAIELNKEHFVGWYLNAECTEPLVESEYLTEDTTIFAKYANTNNLTLVLNGEKIIISAYTDETLQQALQNAQVDTTSIKGWKDAKGHSVQLGSYITSAQTLYAEYENTKQVTVVINGEETVVTSLPGQTISDVLKLVDYETENLVGWYIDDEYKNKVTNLSTKITEDMHLYARYAEHDTLTLVIPGKDSIEITVYDDESLAQVLENSSLTIENFVGWYLDEQLQNPVTIEALSQPITVDTTLYARCTNFENEKVEICVYNTQNSEYQKTEVDVTFYEDSTLWQVLQPIQEGLTNFIGWYTDANFEEPANLDEPSINFANQQSGSQVCLYARCAETISITINSNGVEQSKTYYADALVTIEKALQGCRYDKVFAESTYTNEIQDITQKVTNGATYFLSQSDVVYKVNDAGVDTEVSYAVNAKPTIAEVLSQNPVYAQKIADGKACTVATTSSMASGSVVTDLTATAEPGVTYYFAYNVSPKYYHNGETITSEGWHSQNSIADFITGLKDVLQVSSLKLFSDDDYINEIENSETKIADATYHVSMPVELTLDGGNLPDGSKTYTAYSHMTYAQAMQEIANYLHSTPQGKEGYYGGVVNYFHIDAGNVNSEEELNSHVGTVDGFYIYVQTKFTITLHVQQPDGSFIEEFGSGYYGEILGELGIMRDILQKYGAEGLYYQDLWNYDIYYSKDFLDTNLYIRGDEPHSTNDYAQHNATYYARRYTKLNIDIDLDRVGWSLFCGEIKFYNDTNPNKTLYDIITSENNWGQYSSLTVTCDGKEIDASSSDLTKYSNKTIQYVAHPKETTVDVMVYDGTSWQKYTTVTFDNYNDIGYGWGSMEGSLPSVEKAGVLNWYVDQNCTKTVEQDYTEGMPVHEYFSEVKTIYGKKIQKVTFTIQGDQYTREEGVCVADIYSWGDAYYAFVAPGEYDVYMTVLNEQKVVYDGEYDGDYVLQDGDAINFYGVAITESITVVVDGVSNTYDRDINIDIESFLQGVVGVSSWIGIYEDSTYQYEIDLSGYYTGSFPYRTVYIKTMYTVSYLTKTVMVAPGTDLTEIGNEVLNNLPDGHYDHYICVNGERVDYASYKIYADIDVSLESVAQTETIIINYGSGTKVVVRDLNNSLLQELANAGYSSDETCGLYANEQMTIPVENFAGGISGYTTIYTRMATDSSYTYYMDPTSYGANYSTHYVFTFTELADGTGYSVAVDLNLANITSFTEVDFPRMNFDGNNISWAQYLSNIIPDHLSEIVIPETHNGKPVKKITSYDVSHIDLPFEVTLYVPKYVEFESAQDVVSLCTYQGYTYMEIAPINFIGGRMLSFTYTETARPQYTGDEWSYDCTYNNECKTIVFPLYEDYTTGALSYGVFDYPESYLSYEYEGAEGMTYYTASNIRNWTFKCPNV